MKFLLATTEVNKLPITILSRCLQFQLKNMTVDRISSYLANALKDEGIEYDTGALRIIGTAAAGSMRDALSVTDQAISFGAGSLKESQVAQMLGVTGRDEISALLTALAGGQAQEVLNCAGELAERGVDFASVLAELIRSFHDIAVAQILPVQQGENPAADTDSAEHATDLVADSLGVRFAESFAPDVVQLFYQIALRSHHDLAMSPDPQIGFEMALLRMLAFAPEDVAQRVPPLAGPTSAGPTSAGPTSSQSDRGSVEPGGSASNASEGSPPQRVNALVESKQSNADPLPRAPDSFWFELQDQIGAQGIIAMIMRNSVLHRRETLPANAGSQASDIERWYLQLDPAHDGMLSDRHPAQIASLVSAATDTVVEVNLTVAEPLWETPGMQVTRERKERQETAIALMRESAMVKSLEQIFGAQLDEASVRPITDAVPSQQHTGEQ